MINERLILEGFLSYRERQQIDFPDVSVCLVNGAINGDTSLSNGAGKSTLFEAIPVASFGKIGGRGERLDEYINDNSKKMYIEHIFKVDNVRYKNVFQKERGASAVREVFYDKNKRGTIEEAYWKKIDKNMDEIIGLSFATYNSTVYLNERDALKFIDGTSNDRKEILRELLNIKIYEKSAKKANNQVSDLTKKIELTLNSINTKQEQMTNEVECKGKIKELQTENKQLNNDIKGFEKRINDIEKDKKIIEVQLEKQQDIQQQIEDVQQKYKELLRDAENKENKIQTLRKKYSDIQDEMEENEGREESLKKEQKELKKTIAGLKADIKEDVDYDKLLKELESKKEESNKLIMEKEKQRSTLQTERKQIEKLIQKIEDFGSVCPITEQKCPVVDDSYKDKYKEEKKSEIAKIDKKIAKAGKEIDKIENEKESIDEQQEKYWAERTKQGKLEKQITAKETEFSEIKNEIKMIAVRNTEGEKKLEEYKQQGVELKEEISKIEENIVKAEEKRDELKSKIEDGLQRQLDKLEVRIEGLKEEQSEYVGQLNENNERIAVFNDKLKQNKDIQDEIKALLKTNEELMHQKKVYVNLSKLLGKEGIQKSIMKQIIPFLELSSTELLKIFNSDSEKIKIKFDLDPKTASGSLKKGGGLDIIVIEEGKKPKDLRMYSGGETVRLVFSIILGLAKLLSKRSGKRQESLIIDEKIAKLDRRGIEQFSEVIGIISQWYKRIFIITHLENLKDMFNEGEIFVNKVDNTSIVTIR